MESALEWTQVDVGPLLEQLRVYAFPRLARTVGLLLLAVVAHTLLGLVVRRVISRFVAGTETEIDDAILRAVHRVLLLSIWFWAMQRVAVTWDVESGARAVSAAWIVALAFPAAGLISDAMEFFEQRAGRGVIIPLDQTALPLLNKIVRFLVVALAALVALEYLGIDVTPVLAGAGVAGLAVSLAAKDTLSNLIAGILLIMDRPFRVGDRIELWSAPGETGSWGDVVEVGLRATKIRNPDNLIIVIPNNEIMRRDIVNYTASGEHIRLRIPFGIAYEADLDQAKALLVACAGKVVGVQATPAPVVIVRSFGESAVNLELRVWIEEARRRRTVADQITECAKKAFHREGVEIPYPKRDLYVKESGGLAPPTMEREEAEAEDRETEDDPAQRS